MVYVHVHNIPCIHYINTCNEFICQILSQKHAFTNVFINLDIIAFAPLTKSLMKPWYYRLYSFQIYSSNNYFDQLIGDKSERIYAV